MQFVKNLARWVLVAVPATYTNSMLVSLALRARRSSSTA